jgi:hypothetical protein
MGLSQSQKKWWLLPIIIVLLLIGRADTHRWQ